MAKVNVTKAINKVLVPALKERGFSVMEALEETPTWREGRHFRRLRDGREEVVLIGRAKFGGALGLNIARGRSDGSTAYMDWHNRGLTRERLSYTDDASLNELLEFLIFYFDGQVAPWLDSVQ